MTTFRRAALAFTVLMFAGGTWPALAAEEPPVVTAILKNWEAQFKTKPSYQSLTAEADGSVVINGLSAKLPGNAGGNVAFSVGTMKLSGISDRGNGLYEIAAADYADMKMEVGVADLGTQTLFTMSVPQSKTEYWYVKTLAENPTPADTLRASMNIAKKMSSGPVAIAAGGQTFSADGYLMTWDGDPVTGAGKTDFKVSNIVVPETAIAMMDPSGMLKQLGYTSLSFDIGGAGDMSVAADRLGFDFDVYYAGKDMATLKVGAGAAEIPAALITELQKVDARQQPDANALMPLVQGIQISRILLRFEDRSITKKVLPMIAAMQGMDEATMIANAGAMLQLGLAELRNPAFTQKAVEAVNAYLKDPRSLTIMAKPAQPVSVMQLMALDPANPGAAIDQLGVTISAND